MKFGVSAPNRGPLSNAEDIQTIADKAEALGFAYLTVSDHIVVPTEIDSTYPYSETGEFPGGAGGNVESMEQFTLLTWLAAITSNIGLLTSVTVVPHRSPLFMAKSLATIDKLSGGRVTFGCGAGWMREEFEALGLPPFDARGRVTNEYIEAIKAVWTQDRPVYQGEFVNFDKIGMDPKPVQTPHPPIWIGGESLSAMRRTVAMGDTWYPFGSNPAFRMDKVETYRARVAKLHGLATDAGRDPASIGLAYNCAFHMEEAAEHQDGGRLIFTGTAEQRAGDIRDFAEIGTTSIIINLTALDLNAMLDRMEDFATNVVPLTSG
ncbi:MAG: LLM class F420-dependent oxidoreductase [Rhodospirillaceae bacterium]|jgi:probable F420-dependent oxidoreductase|nr:LLM class F420-dependent oxidoreductase [Rhodospirillaceae bacterium]MBT3491834.1 LLM class F420-dependent oxidoreductase [Rhodospirillaceae bacterium]MBT3783110.1 LLM class F420-dependent oxidoreductase [Rhodospirillaceae bacterium]MBT3978106.1 LLM class F420-dependent oxidoreductase [Rhodospirillaceae bacterium]MBT4167746.1 LLM class F420-dependent oxidoreductase [Rhodospirillaceae bacterium]